jgi:hypothetical protein
MEVSGQPCLSGRLTTRKIAPPPPQKKNINMGLNGFHGSFECGGKITRNLIYQVYQALPCRFPEHRCKNLKSPNCNGLLRHCLICAYATELLCDLSMKNIKGTLNNEIVTVSKFHFQNHSTDFHKTSQPSWHLH